MSEEAELIEGALESFSREFRVALPGRIESYDASKQRASIRLQLSFYMPTTDGLQQPIDHGVIQNVPICFPQGGGFFCSFPLAKGDPVMVVFNDVPIGAWLAKGQPCEPGVDDMHGLGGAVAFPGGPQPSKTPLQSANASTMKLGKDNTPASQIEFDGSAVKLGGGANLVALANLVNAELDKIAAALAAATAPSTGGSVTYGTATYTRASGAGNVSAQNVKAT